MEVKDMFFCYSINLYDFLKNKKGFAYLLTANHIHTGKQFWIFNKNDELNQINLVEQGKFSIFKLGSRVQHFVK